jgi:hypothetical protein
MADTSASVALASAIAVAAVAGSISVFNLLVNKDQKISEYRQKWLEDVRADTASMVAQAHCLFGYLFLLASQKGVLDANTYLERAEPVYDELNRACTRLKLRLNNSKPEHKAVLDNLGVLETLLGDVAKFRAYLAEVGETQITEEVNKATDSLVNSSSTLIKTTWERVKAGEPTYRVGKWLVTGLTVLAFAILTSVYIQDKKVSQPTCCNCTTCCPSANNGVPK